MNGMTGIVIFLLTTLSGGATGMYFSGRLSERCRVINSYITLVQSMNCYIGFSGYKLAEIFRAEQKSSGCYISDKLVELSENGGDISDEWDICVSKSGYLKEDDRQILSELGRTIGKSNTDGETAVARTCGAASFLSAENRRGGKKTQGQIVHNARDNARCGGRNNADIESGGVV